MSPAAATKRAPRKVKSTSSGAECITMPHSVVRDTAVWDTETTGLLKPGISDLSQQPHIIELAVAILNPANVVLERHSWLIKPPIPISDEIVKITGLTNADLHDKPSFAEVLPEIERVWLGIRRSIAHNAPFDQGMLVNELTRIGKQHAFPYAPLQVCTVQVASDLYFGRRARMIELYKRVTGRDLAQTHRAMDDVDALVEIVQGMEL